MTLRSVHVSGILLRGISGRGTIGPTVHIHFNGTVTQGTHTSDCRFMSY